MQKRMLSALLSMCIAFFSLFGAMTVTADQSQNDQKRVASEYLSENMYSDFENTADEKTVAVAAGVNDLALSCKSAILIEASTGAVLYEHNADEVRAPASITKIMTLLLVMEAIEDSKLSLDDTIVTGPHARSKGGSQIWLEDGEQMTAGELIKAVAVASANDAATALAEHIAGSEEAFVVLMNNRAKSLGMYNTNFVNCCGLDADGHVTTARDIAIMSRELLKHDMIREYSQIWMDYLRGGKTQLVNTNKLVRFYKGCTGLKTGTTDDAGFCVSASAERDGMELIAVVLAGETSDKRFSDAKAMLNYGFANYTVFQPDISDVPKNPIRVHHGVKNEVGVLFVTPDPLVMKKGSASKVSIAAQIEQELEAPVNFGDTVGRIIYECDGEIIGESAVTSADTVEKMSFKKALEKLLKKLVCP